MYFLKNRFNRIFKNKPEHTDAIEEKHIWIEKTATEAIYCLNLQ